ncbi:GNAT family N-acetyltransferase [Leptolyngbya sp. 7M]|uniref:GNAT family N-acetyltransferase n=1 Tax=Leptolyngbya sp. 7M TaxID=2812896 RepID=UPI001B8C7468|nr:GNAT family N-acetyltransferase [Leptolyngbya sp. 7M]QYO65322.1 GNAT family N-acetyltransferase [Leptolyngbya sp. 7M]
MHDELKIVSFDPTYAADFAQLNYAWIEKYFEIEPHDREVLDNPQQVIIDTGGEVFFALISGQAVGTTAMIRSDQATFELTKMAVDPDYQGNGIANHLMDACIKFARSQKASTIFLETNSKLSTAIGLYRKFGFVETPLDPNSQYSRADLRMELALKGTNL